MNAYRAIGRRTDNNEIVTISGKTPADARTRLMSRYLHLVDVRTEWMDNETRYKQNREERQCVK